MRARNDDLYIYDILECCKKIDEYLFGVDRELFDGNRMMQDAVVRNIEIIGEAAKGYRLRSVPPFPMLSGEKSCE